MALPKSVQAQADQASKFFAQDENPGDTPPAPGTETKDQEDQAAAESQDDTATDPNTTGQDADTSKHEPDQDALYWRHRYDVLQGKYNKEVPALHQEVKRLKQAVADKEARIAELEKAAGQSGQPGQLSDDKLQQMRVDFGDDLVDAMLDLARSSGGGGSDEVARLRQELEEIRAKEQQREQEQLEDAKARFWSTLEAQVPKWREINASPAFHQFLAQLDERTGQPRQQTLEAAQQVLDPAPVVAIFQSFQTQAGATQTPAPDPDHVEPPRSRATDTAPQGQGGTIWTRAKIRQFYEDKRRGRYSKDEAARLEADIFAAQQEGRIR